MGRLQELSSGRQVTLLANHTIGRDERCDLSIPDQRVSLAHAAVRWDGAQWSLRDTGSTNQTFLNGTPILPTVPRPLRLLDEIDFGTASAWKVVDVSRPMPTATAVTTGERTVSDDAETLQLSPDTCLYRGDAGVWHTRDGRKADDFRDGDEISEGGIRFRLSLPEHAHPTTPAGGLVGRRASDIRLTLSVSAGEDRIEVLAHCGGVERAMGRHGNNRVLLELARARLQDQAEQLAPSVAGWRCAEEIGQRIYGDLPRLNTEVHRIRKRFAVLGVVNFADVIERDEDFIRLGIEHVSIHEM